MSKAVHRYFAQQAWVQGAWANDVLLEVNAQGAWSCIVAGAMASQHPDAIRLEGAVVPGIVNAHSHAFQRAIAGLTERRNTTGTGSDDFWSWRQRMYSAANRITPEQLEIIATQLYFELLAGGFTQVCEFHYLHHDVEGRAYVSPAEMSLALVQAAQRTGIGLTLLPTLYMHAGFATPGLNPNQRRFANTPDSMVRIIEAVQREAQGLNQVRVGVALHSLRAVDLASLTDMAAFAKAHQLPVHIHIAEQRQEVEDCLQHTRQRPIGWLLDHVEVDARWNLVHATQTTPAELQGIQAVGASVVICPATEANLGDGIFDLPAYAKAGGRWSVGTDSHVTRCWSEELRLLEYSQRLNLRQRNVSATQWGAESSAQALVEGAVAGGTQASGVPLNGIGLGQRADFVTLDLQAPALLGIPPAMTLDAYVFSSPAAPVKQAWVAGRAVPVTAPQDNHAFAQVMQMLWA